MRAIHRAIHGAISVLSLVLSSHAPGAWAQARIDRTLVAGAWVAGDLLTCQSGEPIALLADGQVMNECFVGTWQLSGVRLRLTTWMDPEMNEGCAPTPGERYGQRHTTDGAIAQLDRQTLVIRWSDGRTQRFLRCPEP